MSHPPASIGTDRAPLTIRGTAQRGFAAGADAYRRSRPGYPAGIFTLVERNRPLSEIGAALDLGAGTGKFTALLAERLDTVFALEVVPEMLLQLQSELPQVPALCGDAHQLPFADASFGLVTAATAFHWFDDELARTEIARVLAPEGAFMTVSNRRVLVTEFDAAIEGLLDRLRPPPVPTEARSDRVGFVLLDELEVAHVHNLDAPSLLSLVASMSYVASLEESIRRSVLDEARSLIGTRSAGLNYVARASLYRPGRG